jgi:hypothetical protein
VFKLCSSISSILLLLLSILIVHFPLFADNKIETVYPVFKLWTLALHSASMTFKLLAFNVLSDIIQSLRKCYTTSITTSLAAVSTGVDSSDPTSAPYPSLAPLNTPLSVLEACLSLLPVSRLKAAAAKRLWHEMEDFPSYSRYIQVRHCLVFSIYLCTHQSIYLSIYLSFFLRSFLLFLPLSIHLFSFYFFLFSFSSLGP